MINLDDYKPIIDTTTLSDEEIELWYGSKFAVRFLRLIEGCEIKTDIDIFYFKDDKYLMEYDLKREKFWINYEIWSILGVEFRYGYQKIEDLTTTILGQYFKQNVITTNYLKLIHDFNWDNR